MKGDGQYLHELLPLLLPLPQPPHSQLLFDSEMIIGMLREMPKNWKLDVFGLTGKDTITYLEKIFTLHSLEQSVPQRVWGIFCAKRYKLSKRGCGWQWQNAALQ